MGEKTGIGWTDHTFNPWRGCTKVSAGCANCYAEKWSKRNPAVLGIWGDEGTRVIASEKYWRDPIKWDDAARASGVRRRVFCASLADVFEDRPELVAPRERLLDLIAATPCLDWQLLTKRPENAFGPLPPNVWLGVSVEYQERVARVNQLAFVAARTLFVSVEPMLGPVHFTDADAKILDWVIVGGESAHDAVRRPFNPDWAREVRDWCAKHKKPFFMKQVGGRPGHHPPIPADLDIQDFPEVKR